jgi:hypothetical protein
MAGRNQAHSEDGLRRQSHHSRHIGALMTPASVWSSAAMSAGLQNIAQGSARSTGCKPVSYVIVDSASHTRPASGTGPSVTQAAGPCPYSGHTRRPGGNRTDPSCSSASSGSGNQHHSH